MQTNKLPYGSQWRVQLIPVIRFRSIDDSPSATSFIYVGSPWVSFEAIVAFANLKSLELNIKFPLNRHLIKYTQERYCEQSHIYITPVCTICLSVALNVHK